MSRLTRDRNAEPFRETRFSGANGDREMFIFSVQLTTSRIGSNLTRLILILLYVMTIHMIHHGNNPLASEVIRVKTMSLGRIYSLYNVNINSIIWSAAVVI